MELPADLVAQLPRTSGGLPIVMQVPLGADALLQVAFDARRDDPITRLAQCLEQALACANADDTASTRCIAALPRCASAAGGVGCCPGACLDRFADARNTGRSVDDALGASFLGGECVTGLPRSMP